MRAKRANRDAQIAHIAARQHGVVARAQLLALDLKESAIGRRVEQGHLHRVHRGVYAVGHAALSQEGRWMAAVLACERMPGRAMPDGRRATALSHRSAAELWGLLEPRSGLVHVTIAGDGGRRRRTGIALHRSRTLGEKTVARRLGIPVTTPARTIADLRATASGADLRRAIRQAEVLGLATGLSERREQTRSELEDRFLALCGRHRLPAPLVNARLDRFTVDFLWPARRLVVETDGYRFHRGRQAFEDDRARDAALRMLGYDVIRLSFRQVAEQPAVVAALLRRSLGKR